MVTQATIGQYEYRLSNIVVKHQRLAQRSENVGKSPLA